MITHVHAGGFRFLTFLLVLFGLATPALAQGSDANVQTTWRLLDYVAVDYGEAIAEGKIVNAFEYDEMLEFSKSVAGNVEQLPSKPVKAKLQEGAARLRRAIEAKVPPAEVAVLARGLGSDLLAAYPVPLAPASTPDMSGAAPLYAQACASCHGLNGEGPTAQFAKLDPPPIAFADRERAKERSVFGLYQVITQGLEGTAMQSFASLPDEQRWALAFHSGRLAFASADEGERIWKSDQSIRRLIPDMTTLAAITPAALASRIGEEKAFAVIAYLRANPGAVTGAAKGDGSLQLVREKLQQSLAAYREGNARVAEDLALTAYLEGFEPVEGVLATRDGELMLEVERALSGFRAAIGEGVPADVLAARVEALGPLLDRAEAALAPEAASDVSTFLGAFGILLREGLEAILVVIAMIAFLRKAERPEVLPYVHGGWVAALLAGAVTWLVATYVVGISGASREITEGFGSLIAALVLLSVGIWMHNKSQADEWRRYIQEKMGQALSRGSAWFLFGLAFIVVYREVFETILFYAALWNEDNGGTILAGALTAAVLLAVIAWVMLRYSRKLPITQFFAYSAILIAILAVVLAGKGIGALQEGGLLPITLVPGVPRITLLGIFPTAEAIGAQLLTLAVVVFGFRANRRAKAAPEPVAAE